jgi:hypothetical protein
MQAQYGSYPWCFSRAVSLSWHGGRGAGASVCVLCAPGTFADSPGQAQIDKGVLQYSHVPFVILDPILAMISRDHD